MKYWKLSIIPITIIPLILLSFGLFTVEANYERVHKIQIEKTQELMNIIKKSNEDSFGTVIKAQESIAKIPEFSIIHPELINDSIKGIPKDEEKIKRQLASNMIDEFGFSAFGITITDGRMYLLEPYSSQLQIKNNDFSQREYFQGVLTTKKTYVSDVFISAASNKPVIVISTPIFSNDGDIIGMFGGSMDLEFMTKEFSKNIKDKTRIMLLDDKDTIIVDTNDSDNHKIIPDYITNYDYKQDKSIDQDDDGIHIFFTNLKIQNKNWKLFTITDDSYMLSIDKKYRDDRKAIIIFLMIFASITGVILYRSILKNQKLTNNLKANQSELIKKERLASIGELSARIAHDIKNPLSNIKMTSKLLEKRFNDEKSKEYLQIIDRGIERISHQIDDVLGFIKQTPIKKEPKDIVSFINQTIKEMRIPSNITINTKGNSFIVNIDELKMQRVLVNLIVNSIQAIGDKNGFINIEVLENSKESIIKISDSGDGIIQDDIKHIFDPLFTTKSSGTGLGLASVKNIIEQHEGQITFSNEPTCFTIKIPRD